jgi:hypothetical protein
MVLHLLQLLIYRFQVNMAETVNIKKTIYDANSFKEVVNTSFSQLVPKDPPVTLDTGSIILSVQDFFRLYNNLFFTIPTTGSINSHEYIVDTSLKYLGVSLDNIYNELELLRQENVRLKNQIVSSTFTNLTP